MQSLAVTDPIELEPSVQKLSQRLISPCHTALASSFARFAPFECRTTQPVTHEAVRQLRRDFAIS
jgi:hypothetical protein